MNMRLFFILLFLLAAIPGLAQTNYAPATVSPIDCSGTISVSGQSQTVIAAGLASHGYLISNLDTAEALWINPTGAAAQVATPGSHPLPAGATTTFAGIGSFGTIAGMGTGARVSVTATTAGHKFSCAYW